MAARTRFFRACSLILSPSKKSIARDVLPLKPALKSLSGSGRLAPREKVSFTLSLWALPTAIIPSRDHTGLPIHFHSSMISRSASRMLFRMLASVLPRQSVSFAISSSIRSDGFIGSLRLQFLSRFHARGWSLSISGRGLYFIELGDSESNGSRRVMHNLDPQRATKRPSGIVRFRTVVIHENRVVAAITKEGAAKFSDIRRCFHPARRFRIEMSKFLQLSLFFFL